MRFRFTICAVLLAARSLAQTPAQRNQPATPSQSTPAPAQATPQPATAQAPTAYKPPQAKTQEEFAPTKPQRR